MKKCEKGQGLVEFVIIFPLIALVIVGVVALFQGLAVLVTTEDAAREGARVASVWRVDGATTCEGAVNEAVQRTSPWFVPANGDTVTVSPNCTNGVWDRVASGTLITVTVDVNWEPLFFSSLGQDVWEPPTTVALSSSVIVRHE